MKFKFLFLLLLICTAASSQKLKKVETTTDKYPRYKEVFYVLKKNKSVRHGEYKKVDAKGLVVTGYYKNGIKDSIWNFYTDYGEVEQTYDFTRDTLLYNIRFSDIDTTGDTVYFPPFVIGGERLIHETIVRNIMYPPLAVENRKQGTIRLSFEIDESGLCHDLRVESGVDGDLDAEAYRVIKITMTELTWRPATVNGKKVRMRFFLPVKFKIN